MLSARVRLLLGALLTAVLGLWFVLGTLPTLRIETDITAMLPQTAPDASVRKALDQFGAAASRRNLFLVGAPDFDIARSAAAVFATTLRDSPAFTDVQYDVVRDASQLDSSYGTSRVLLLSDRHRALLAAGDTATLHADALRALYTPAGLARVRPFAEDPFDFYGDFLSQLAAGQGRIMPRGSLLVIEHEGRIDVLVTATLRDNPFSLSAQGPAVAAILAARAAAEAVAPEVSVIGSGVIRHAAANSDRAQREVSLFGTLSMIGVILIFVLSFRSPRPLLLMLATLGISGLASLVVTHAVFGEVHLLALVFGSSLIGVAVDYSLHFFTDQFRAPQQWTGSDAIGHVGTAIVVGMLTTSLGYIAFMLPPFPGLRQMAVFSIAGIFSAGLCVLLLYPALAGRGRAAPAAVATLMARLASLSRPRTPLLAVLIVVGIVACVVGLLRLQFVDDVRALQSSPAELLHEEQALRERLGGGADTRFFLIRGADAETVLQREEALRARLDAAIANHALSGYMALSRQLPSLARQRENGAWLQQQVYGEGAVMPALLAELGFAPDVAARNRARFEAGLAAPLPLTPWLASAAGAPWRDLWLGDTGDGVASVIALNGVRDVAALPPLADALPGVRLIDRVADISTVLAHYRNIALLALAGTLAAIGAVLAIRYGLRGGLRHLLAPLGGGVLTLGALGLLGVHANLFTVLALLLVLGLGVDYTVFLREGEDSRPSTLLAITLAALTTLLSFGMLAASGTPFIRSIGLAVLLGVFFTWILAVLASAPATAARHSDNAVQGEA